MTAVASESGGRPGNDSRFGLTQDALFCLWRAAIKDDDKLIDQIIGQVYDDMVSFDRKRAETVMGLAVRRHREAKPALRALLDDIEKTKDQLFPLLRAKNLCRL
jgi:hypothetical protein